MDLNTQLKPTVVSNPHPLIGDGRVNYYEGFKAGETLGEYVARVGVEIPKGSFVVIINGCVAMHDWRLYVLQEGDDIVFRSSALGGGGGGKVLRLVAMVALSVAAVAVGGWAAGAMGFVKDTFAFGLASSLVGAAVMIGGTMLINAILPPPKPQLPNMTDKEQSPTYGINAGRNQSNPYGPMLLVFGRHKVVPFLGSKPYTTFNGDDQYLSQVFHLGLQTDLNIEEMRIGNTNIAEYDSVDINRSLHDGELTLVAGNVDLLDGFELSNTTGWVSRTTPQDTESISVDIAANLYDIADDGSEKKIDVTIEAQYRKVGTERWYPLGGYSAAPASKYWSLGRYVSRKYTREGKESDRTYTVTTWQQVRYGSTKEGEHTEGEKETVCHKEMRPVGFKGGLQEVNVCETYTWRYIDHPATAKRRGFFNGVKTGAWQGIAPDPYGGYEGTGQNRLQGSNPQKPTRYAIDTTVEKGQYEVRLRKVDNDISTTRKSNKVTVAQIRCTQTDEADYTGQLRLAVRIKATSQLNGAIDTFNVIASAKCPVWNGSAWEEKETSNPAWWFLWWARGKRDANFKRLYGECLPDNRIDIEAIKAWAAFCDRKKLSFNWVLDRKMSVEEVYYTIARAGRASTTWQTGKRGVIWDSDELPVTTLLTPANIIAGSFSYKHINTDVADEIILNYYDANKDWEKAVVRQKVPNATQANNPITLDLEGCTNESQAGREANLLAASQQLHRKQYSFEMDIEGAVLTRGDVAQLTHDLTSFAAGGRLVAVNGNVLTLDADVGTATNAWLTLRSPFNKMYNVRVNAKGNQLTLVNGWTFGDVGNVEDWLWQYDPSKIAGVKLQIKSVVPQSNGNIKFEAIEYSPAYFAAENNVYFAVPQKQARDLPAISVFDALATERVLNEQNGDTEVTISWIMSELADASVVIRRGRDVLFNDNVRGSAVSVVAREGDTLDVEIVPFTDRRTSRVFNKSFVVVGTNVVVPAPTGLKIIGAFTKSAVTIQWDRVINAVGYEVQVLSGSTVRRTVKVGDVLTYTYAFADMSQDGGAVRSLTFKVRALGQRSAKSSWVSVSGKNPQVAALQGIKVESNIKSLMFTCEKPQDEDFAGYLVWISDNKSFVPTLANVSHDGSFNQVFFNGFNGQPLEQKDYYIWCAGYDAFGKDELNISGYFVAQPAILKLDPQSIAAEMIQDGALTMTKFAQGIKPPRIAQELPATGELNDLVVLESTSTMYRWDGTQWNSRDVTPPDGSITNAKLANGAVNASKIASGAVTNGAIANGAITNAKLGNGSVSSTKLANGSVGNAHLQENSVGSNQLQVSSIVAEKIADNAVSASKIINNAISNAHLRSNSVSTANIVANAINNSHLQTGSVTTDKIASNSINTGHLQSNIINASHIQTGSITASKLAVMGDNLILDPSFDDGDYWGIANNPNWTSEVLNGKKWIVNSQTLRAGSNTAWVKAIATSRAFPVKDGERYFVGADIWVEDGAQAKAGVPYLVFYKNDDYSTPYYAINKKISIPGANVNAGQNLFVYMEAEVPEGCTSARFFSSVYALTSGGAKSGTVRIANPVVRLMTSGELIVDGSITSDKIVANAINTTHLASNSVTAQQIASGAITTDKLAANSVNANAIASNSIGTNHLKTNIINANHIQTGSITASKLAVMGDNLILDPSFDDINYWQTTYFRSLTKEIIDGKVWGKAVVDRTISTPGGWAGSIQTNSTFDVKEGDEYLLSIDIWIDDGGQLKYNKPTIVFYQADNLNAAIFGAETLLDNTQYPLQAGQKYTIVKGLKVPSGCSKARFYSSFSALPNQTNVTATIRYSNPTIRLRSSGELIVDGSIVSRHIIAGAITTDHIQVGAVGGTQISNNAISTQHIQSNAITTDLIQVGAVGQTQIKPDSINTGHLIAGSVTAPIIAAGAVGADQIAANAISSKHLMIGDLSNLVLNGNQQRGLEGYSSDARTPDGIALQDPDSGSPTGKAVILKARDHFWGGEFDVSPGAAYFFKFACYRSGEAKQIGLGLQLKGKDNKIIGWPLGAIKKTTDSNSWGYYEGLIEIPANAVKAKVFLQIDQLHTDRLTKAYVSAIEVRRASHGTMIKDGSITTLKLKAGEIDGNVIKVNTLNGDKIIGNSIHGDKITAGTINGNRIVANTLHGNAITAGTIYGDRIAARTLNADRLKAGTLTAASGVIADAAITNAKIANLSVNTIKIANNSITDAYYYSVSRYLTNDGRGSKKFKGPIDEETIFSTTISSSYTVVGFFGITKLTATGTILGGASVNTLRIYVNGTELFARTALASKNTNNFREIIPIGNLSGNIKIEVKVELKDATYDDYMTWSCDFGIALFKK